MNFDIVLEGGTLLDGTGSAQRRADVGVVGDRVSATGDLKSSDADLRIDCTGRVVAPGFVDDLILGGTLERFPTLKVGVAECHVS